MTVIRKARAAIEVAHGVEKGGCLAQGLGLGIGTGDILVPPRRQVEDRQARREKDEGERRRGVRRKRRKNGRRKR